MNFFLARGENQQSDLGNESVNEGSPAIVQMFNIRWKVLTSFCFLMIVENSVYWIRELIAHCQRKYQHNSYSDSNGPLCEDLQDPQQHSCKKLEYIRTSRLFIAGGGGKRRIWGRSQGFPGKRRGDQHKGGGGTRRIPQGLMGGSGKFLQNPPIPLFYPPPPQR